MSWLNILKNRNFDGKIIEVFKRKYGEHDMTVKTLYHSPIISKEEWNELIQTYGREELIHILGNKRYTKLSKKISSDHVASTGYERAYLKFKLLECYIEEGRFYTRFEISGEEKNENDEKIPFSTVGGAISVFELSFDHQKDLEEIIDMSSSHRRRKLDKLRSKVRRVSVENNPLNLTFKVKRGKEFMNTVLQYTTSWGPATSMDSFVRIMLNAYYHCVHLAAEQVSAATASTSIIESYRKRKKEEGKNNV